MCFVGCLLMETVVYGWGKEIVSISILKSETHRLPWSLFLKPWILNFGDRGLEAFLINPVSGTWKMLTKYLLALK